MLLRQQINIKMPQIKGGGGRGSKKRAIWSHIQEIPNKIEPHATYSTLVYIFALSLILYLFCWHLNLKAII